MIVFIHTWFFEVCAYLPSLCFNLRDGSILGENLDTLNMSGVQNFVYFEFEKTTPGVQNLSCFLAEFRQTLRWINHSIADLNVSIGRFAYLHGEKS